MTKKWLYEMKRREEKEKMAEKFNFEERKEIPFFKFEKMGQYAEGYLISIDPAIVGENKTHTMVYTTELFTGGRIRFLGTKNINDKLGPDCLGRPIRVKWIGENPDAGRNGNPMREFWVGIDWNDKNKRSELVITDADVAAFVK